MSSKWSSGESLPYVTPRGVGEPDAWTAESACSGGTQRLIGAGEASPPSEVRRALSLSDGEAAIVRRRVMYINDTPIELTDSWYPRRVAAGTALAEPRKIRGGAPTLLAELGYTTRFVTEEVGVRPVTSSESDRLGLTDGEGVLTLLRTTRTADREPIEVSLMVMKGPRRIRYEIEVD
ncbi:GntR family transcriptional regulator [Streptomyces chrestomyceticus JCM 4735]|uniref:GntR family transcriptional regulator n=1 Tax=Streptomyces chrestomyceticus JCM 4735 TaxID=1306181 RepID=A0A7U9PZ06_9ACTN|nr:UTRA domain-containing protein [Streptomyces chrestomyceticus]GCD37987.1 GntR family transcriptional regulator [Streptomyces chrestomyceticus JCM 4735]